jgi:hypothetical protein
MLFNKKNTNKRRFPTKLEDITIEDFLYIELLKKQYNNENKLYNEIIKYYNNGKDLPNKEAELNILKIVNILNEEPKFTQTFKLNGVEYGFIPNLDNITTGEYIDLDEYQKQEDKIHNIMAILYRPINNKMNKLYTIEEYEGSSKYSEIMKKAPISIYLGAMVFFYDLSKILLNDLITSTKKEIN